VTTAPTVLFASAPELATEAHMIVHSPIVLAIALVRAVRQGFRAEPERPVPPPRLRGQLCRCSRCDHLFLALGVGPDLQWLVLCPACMADTRREPRTSHPPRTRRPGRPGPERWVVTTRPSPDRPRLRGLGRPSSAARAPRLLVGRAPASPAHGGAAPDAEGLGRDLVPLDPRREREQAR